MTSRNCTEWICDNCGAHEIGEEELEGPAGWWWAGSFSKGIGQGDFCSLGCLALWVDMLRETSGVEASPVDDPPVAAEPGPVNC